MTSVGMRSPHSKSSMMIPYMRLGSSSRIYYKSALIMLETFYNCLNTYTRMVVDASVNGALLLKSYNEAYEILERISNNNYQW
ncbi:hypothetical protein EPI10_028454 [Gossypium australe]|uniref:Uncharacterized protein n=1 Tax=Gossypium australe TaxID=47621 RepID=A0A5B6UUZ3_9ROSI|nr:hypothetical protein EPI10_028454 [Gossypium australe]